MDNLYLILSVSGYQIDCNCDDEKTGLTDDNVLRSMDQLPVTGNVSMVEIKTFTYKSNVSKPYISVVHHGISAG